MRRFEGWAAAYLLAAAAGAGAMEPDWAALPYTTHSEFQAIDADGFGTAPLDAPVKLRGVILNRPADMLPGEPNATPFLGGMWQIYVQADTSGDFGGTACWMGQYIGRLVGNHPAGSYDDGAWAAELARLSFDLTTGHAFAPGDRVEIRARAPGLFHAGKTNVNEQHTNDPDFDFDVVLLQAGAGLPRPKVLRLRDLKDANDVFRFDPTRLTGCERHQGTLVRLNDVWFTGAANWGPNGTLTITDGVNTFPILLGLGPGFSAYPAPSGPFDIIGILDQEDLTPADGQQDGYRLWVLDYEGSGCAIPGPFAIAGDANCDGVVTWRDIDFFVAGLNDSIGAWQALFGSAPPCCAFSNLDVNGDGHVTWRDIDPFIGQLNS